MPALATLALAAALTAAPATQATEAANRTQLELGGAVARQLRAGGVRIATAKPGSATRTTITLPASGLMIESASDLTVTHKPVLTFRAGSRSLKLTVPQLVVHGARTTLTVGVGTRTVTLLTVKTSARTRTIDSAKGRLTLKNAPVTLTSAGAKLLRARLKLRSLSPGRLGALSADVDVTVSGMPPLAPVDGPATPGGAALSAAPATARPLTGGSVAYTPRPSWLGYIYQEGEGASASDGATYAGEPTSGTFTLPISGGWYDPASGSGVIQTSGTVNYVFTGHQIRLALSDWAFDLASTPKATALVRTCLHCSILRQQQVGTRVPLFLAKPRPPASDGATVTWSDVPVTLANEGVSIFLAYLYDSDQGRISATATLG